MARERRPSWRGKSQPASQPASQAACCAGRGVLYMIISYSVHGRRQGVLYGRRQSERAASRRRRKAWAAGGCSHSRPVCTLQGLQELRPLGGDRGISVCWLQRATGVWAGLLGDPTGLRRAVWPRSPFSLSAPRPCHGPAIPCGTSALAPEAIERPGTVAAWSLASLPRRRVPS